MKADRNMLVSPLELSTHLDDPRWVVFDTRHDLGDPAKGRAAYASGHIPGAFFLHLDRDLAGSKTGRNGRHPLPDPRMLAQRLGECGVGPDTQVVAYDDASGSFAARLWWLLRWMGHENAALLDGGLVRWQREGRPMSTDIPPPRRGSFVPRAGSLPTIDAGTISGALGTNNLRILDARAEERYAGRVEPIDPVAGHVPGALNRFWKSNLAADGSFKPAEQLRAEFAAQLGNAEPGETVHMCGSGVTACHNLFAMELAGIPAGRLYPGSWSEWSSDPSRPVSRQP